MAGDKDSEGAEQPIVVAVGSGEGGTHVIAAGKRLADALQCPWEAVHVETPGLDGGAQSHDVAEALAIAARLGASIVKIAAATVADGLLLHLDGCTSEQIVLGQGAASGAILPRRTLVGRIASRRPDLLVHLVPVPSGGRRLRVVAPPTSWRAFGYALLLVIATLALALVLNRAAGVRSLSVLFLFPVLTAAARWGLRSAVLAALLSVAAYNFFFVPPPLVLKPAALQSWLMAIVLIAVALYTGALTSGLRGRIALSERSAQENARLAAFALELTRAADWETTAKTICVNVGALLGADAVLVREIGGNLQVTTSEPSDARLEPLDHTALEWAWSNGVPAGSGSDTLSAANWQFQPLKTSLGMLAVLGLAREDGRNPVPPEKAVLLSTLIAQASLSLERLRMEDLMRGDGPRSNS